MRSESFLIDVELKLEDARLEVLGHRLNLLNQAIGE
jgi:hypothetical protein